jgi:signal transduction histidine kinase
MGMSPRTERIPLTTMLDEIVFDCSTEAHVKGMDVVVTVPDDLTVEADPRLLHSAVANLIRNALKFSRPSSIINVRAKRREGEPRVEIEVEDACGGLPEGKAEELFRPTVRGSQENTGFGLGLAIAQQAALAHGGSLGVRDMPGTGCIFTLTLPTPPAREE